jgi:hypothetical protein
MRKTSSALIAAVLALVLSGVVVAPAFAADREGPRRDDPIVRVIKRLLHKFGIIATDEQPSVPHP